MVWHMHQPYYRDMATGACSMPWVRLHATKDYLDMLKRLDAFPTIHQTFNVVPSLLDQLEEYLPPRNLSDAFLELSRRPATELTSEEQRFVLQWFFMANLERMIKPYPRYHDLLAKRGLHVAEADWPRVQKRFSAQDYLDLQVWFNLAWIDPWLRSLDPELSQLEAKGARFTEEEKCCVLEAHLRLMAQVIPAYRDAASRGQIELAVSPYYHPILPLLCDVRSALVALPHLPMPHVAFRHPEDARWQLQEGLARHQAAFGAPALGVWPPEGSVSEEAAKLAIETGVQWIATDEAILWRTLKTSRSPSLLYRPHVLRRREGRAAIVFRDRELSDLIGFVYSQWDPQIAVDDFMRRLGEIHEQFRASPQPPLVSIILDGENAWECYHRDGHDFFTGLYTALSGDERFRCVTVSEFLRQFPPEQAEPLPELFSGSWIDANFSTWIGHQEKNAAWALLAQARHALSALGGREASRAAAWKSLGAAEGSDWMWWFGDTHFSAQADEFDRLFRMHLANAYRSADLPVPEALNAPIRRRLPPPLHEPTGSIHPTIDGRETSYYEWLYAGRIELTQQYATIQRGGQCLQRLLYGFDDAWYYLRLDLDRDTLAQLSGWSLELALSSDVRIRVQPEQHAVRAQWLGSSQADVRAALDRVLELAIPRKALGLPPADKLRLSLVLLQAGEPLERYPSQGAFELAASAAHLEAHAWSVWP